MDISNFSMGTVFMIVGFLISLYSCVSNDVIQTLGTFLSSNKDKPAWMIWAFASAVLVVTLVWGWFVNNGDMSFGRLTQIPFPDQFHWWHALPPFVLIFLTKWGMPVSTTFLILSIFSSNAIIGAMLTKSVLGYIVALVCSIAIYAIIARPIERYFLYHKTKKYNGLWVAAKWLSTGFLWSQWIMQDAANLFVYLPRKASVEQLILVLIAFVAFLGILAYKRGGEIQNIVKLKTNTQDIRSATIIDLIYALILLYFKEMSNIPMSTTWVFIGLLAGREIALYHRLRFESPKKMYKHILKDVSKASIGLVVSIIVVQTIINVELIKNWVIGLFS